MPPRTLVIYNYYEKDNIYKENFEFFLEHATDIDAHFLITINGHHTVNLKYTENIIYLLRDNVGFDFGAYDDAIEKYTAIEDYDYYFFVNCVVRGPFMPAYCRQPWTEPFLDLLSGDVKLVGPTINILHTDNGISAGFKNVYGLREPYSHVQTTVFALDRECLIFLRHNSFFSRGFAGNKLASVYGHEILLSQLVLARGWNISCLLPEYRGLDYRRIEGDINPTTQLGNLWYKGGYFGRDVHPFETIFFNTNSEICSPELLRGFADSLHPEAR
jgi:hypothetical protein